MGLMVIRRPAVNALLNAMSIRMWHIAIPLTESQPASTTDQRTYESQDILRIEHLNEIKYLCSTEYKSI